MRSNEEALELIFLQPQQAVEWLRLEMFVGLVWSFTVALPSLAYLVANASNCWASDYLLVSWLITISLCKVLDIPVKLRIMEKLNDIEDRLDYENWRFATRRLLDLTHSPLYWSFSILVNISSALHPLGVLRLWQGGRVADELTQLYRLCVIVIVHYVLRCAFGFFNYTKILKQSERQRNWERADFLHRGATLEQIDCLRVESVESKGQVCAVCTEDFELGERVRVLPCGHYFHLPCIDLWLVQNKRCPLCSNELR
mmetsp:Transcript_5959/g.10563  ORF Transcript_5959/g.10563 Transcript_5959/m.10563 type:complete len:256 (-) Transcript_5959:18-785(-)